MVESKSPGEVQAPLTFIVRQDTKPYFNSSALTGGLPEVFFETENRTVTIHDMRAKADDLDLDRDGFELRRWPTTVDDLYDDAAMEQYDREIESLLRDATGADRIVVFDHTRRSDAVDGAANPDGARGPADRVHVDYTVASGPIRAGDVLGADEVERIVGDGGRIVQVNVWRPITGPVERTPLAVAAADSIATDELIAVDQIFPDRTGEIYQLAHATNQRWYWAPAMERDEVLLLKGWDSLDDGRARFTPHGAFRLPGQGASGRPRESIEVRAYLLFEG
jgi:hypothetical protein